MLSEVMIYYGLARDFGQAGYFETEQYLTMALEEGYKVGQKPAGVDVIDAVLAKDIDSLEPRPTRHGYNVKALAELLNAKPGEIRSFLRGKLPPGRTQEFQSAAL
jgi:hypothetical protein